MKAAIRPILFCFGVVGIVFYIIGASIIGPIFGKKAEIRSTCWNGRGYGPQR